MACRSSQLPRRTSFERGLADLHGADVLEGRRAGSGAYVVQPRFVRAAHQPGSLQMGRRKVEHVAFRLGVSLVGLFWVIVLGGALIAMMVVAWAFGAALLGL